MADLFVEVFPVTPGALPTVGAYRLVVDAACQGEALRHLQTRLIQHLRRGFGGIWQAHDDLLLTDAPRTPVELMITLDFLRNEQPERYAALHSIDAIPTQQVPPKTLADFALRSRLRELSDPMQDALDKQETRIRGASVEREHRLQAWGVKDEPAVSISIASRLIYDRNVQQFAAGEREAAALDEKLAGLWVSDPVNGKRGEISGVVGLLRDHRTRLKALVPAHIAPEDLEDALDGEWVISVKIGQEDYEYLASNLWLIVRLPHLPRFDVDPKQARATLQMQPRNRAMLVKAVSDIAKEADMLGSGYNSRSHPELFFSADFEMNLRFGGNRVRPYKAETLAYDFAQVGPFHLREVFSKQPVRVAVVNTLTLKIEDFVEAMQRQLKRSFNFSIEIIRERRVRVVSRSNLEAAVRVVEKENPDIILTFFPDEIAGDDDDSDSNATADYVKSLTLGRGIPTHVIYQSTLDDPEAMPQIIMGIMGKTGSTPYVLAEPLEQVDFVIGLDVVRDTKKSSGETHLTAITRIYRADGKFIGYRVRDLVQEGTELPYVLIRDLFPQREYANKRILIHHDGKIPDDLLQALARWGQAIRAAFYPAEIMRLGAPRIYAIQNGIVNPPWGSAFKLNDCEAILVSSVPEKDMTPQPLHIRCASEPPLPAALPIDRVLRSVLVWTLLAYGADSRPKYPVTTLNAEALAYWLQKGGKFQNNEGEVPFWL